MDWQELTDLTQGQPFVVERVRLGGRDIAIEGQCSPPTTRSSWPRSSGARLHQGDGAHLRGELLVLSRLLLLALLAALPC